MPTITRCKAMLVQLTGEKPKCWESICLLGHWDKYLKLYYLSVCRHDVYNILHKIKIPVTNRTHEIIKHIGQLINCRIQNLVCFIICSFCSTQCVGETASQHNAKISCHSTAKSGVNM